MVLVSHSFVIASGDPAAEPWHSHIGRSPGGVAVEIFFVVSGFLVTGSLLRRNSATAYLLARGLRIYPGLWVSLLATVAAVGFLGLTDRPIADYFSDPQVWRYLLKNSLMLIGGEGALPGTFLENPFPQAVNGSLWTLRYELRLYLCLALLWWATRRLKILPKWLRFEAVAVGAGFVFTLLSVGMLWVNVSSDFVRLAGMFFSGAAFWVLREKISLRYGLALACCGVMAVSSFISPVLFEASYRVCLPYLVIWLAYIPSVAWLRHYNRVGDYSYGVYIYAFPVQQALMVWQPGMSVTQLTLTAAAITAMLAVLSWHLVEKPALSWSSRWRWKSPVATQG